MEALRERLDELQEHLKDQKWLAAHADSLYSTLDSALNSPPQANHAIECLIAICPYLFTRSDFRRWSSLLYDALLNAQLLQDNELQIRVWAQIGEGYYMAGQHQEARNAFETALERAMEGRTQEMMLAAYIGIIKLQSLYLDPLFNSSFLKHTLELSKQVNDPVLQAHLDQSVSVAHRHRGDTVAALAYGQIAYARWHKLKDTLQMARTAFMLADALRIAQRDSQAKRFLDLSATLFAQTNYAPAYCLIAYEEGVIYLKRGEFDAAQQWLTIALDEANKLDHLRLAAMSRQSLAIAQTELENYTQAEKNLRFVLSLWEKLQDSFYQANAFHALGYLEMCRGNKIRAQEWLQQGLNTCNQVPEMPFRQMIEQLINETILELDE
jgi:tetratricopeptide (TPR) repeat protein